MSRERLSSEAARQRASQLAASPIQNWEGVEPEVLAQLGYDQLRQIPETRLQQLTSAELKAVQRRLVKLHARAAIQQAEALLKLTSRMAKTRSGQPVVVGTRSGGSLSFTRDDIKRERQGLRTLIREFVDLFANAQTRKRGGGGAGLQGLIAVRQEFINFLSANAQLFGVINAAPRATQQAQSGRRRTTRRRAKGKSKSQTEQEKQAADDAVVAQLGQRGLQLGVSPLVSPTTLPALLGQYRASTNTALSPLFSIYARQRLRRAVPRVVNVNVRSRGNTIGTIQETLTSYKFDYNQDQSPNALRNYLTPQLIEQTRSASQRRKADDASRRRRAPPRQQAALVLGEMDIKRFQSVIRAASAGPLQLQSQTGEVVDPNTVPVQQGGVQNSLVQQVAFEGRLASMTLHAFKQTQGQRDADAFIEQANQQSRNRTKQERAGIRSRAGLR